MNWKIGQKLVCVKRGPWVPESLPENLILGGPMYDEQVTFVGVHPHSPQHIYLSEYPKNRYGSFNSIQFRPLESHSAHIPAAVRSSLPAIIEEGRDVPAEQPAPVAICGNTNPLTSLLTMIRTDGTMTACGGTTPIWVVMK